MPVVTDIASINGTLFCNSGTKIADVSIPNLTGPFNWTVPGVGNATTVGGNQGVCPMNAFHIEYSGEAWGFLHAIKSPWGPVRCGTITIAPAENGTVTTTTTTMKSTSTSTTTGTPTGTNPAEGDKDGGISTVVIVVIAVVSQVSDFLLFRMGYVCNFVSVEASTKGVLGGRAKVVRSPKLI